MFETEQIQRCSAVNICSVVIMLAVETRTMLETIAVLLLAVWALGLVSSYTMGGFIHILLVVALVALVIRLIQARRV
jgi:Family of unknown function (DUF5670)